MCRLLGGLAARAFDLRLNGREFSSLAALLSSTLAKLLTPTGLAGRSGLVQAYLAAV